MSNYTVEIHNDGDFPVDRVSLMAAVRATLSQENAVDGGSVTVQFVDDMAIQTLNLTYRGVNAPTDVLSFSAELPPMPDDVPSDEANYLGDLAVAYPYALAQANKLGHAVGDVLCLLVVHGTLHLLGYDHDTPEHRARMWDVQGRVLTALDISHAIVPSLEDYT